VIAALAVVCLLVGLSSFGDTPDTRDTTEQVAAYFTDHRTAILVGVVLVGVGLLAFLDVALRLVDGDTRLGRLAQATLGLAIAVGFLGLLLPYAGLAYVVGAESPDQAKAVFSLTLVSTPILAMPLAVAFGAIAWQAHQGSTRRWFVVVTGIAAVLSAWSSCSWMASGPMSPDVQQQVVFQVLVIWLVCAGVAQRRQRLRAG
jgi:hypothetical protein